MFASVHADRSGRILVAADRGAAALDGARPGRLMDAAAIPPGTELIPLPREAVAYDRGGRPRPLGRDRLAVAAIVRGSARLCAPAYVDDPALPPLEPRPYVAVGADESGALVAAVAGAPPAAATAPVADGPTAIRTHPANALAKQLARCVRDHACGAARAGLGRGILPIPLGAPAAERPKLPLDLRSGYDGAPRETVAFRPTAHEIVEVARTHLERGGSGVSFGRACDGEPLGRTRVLEATVPAIRGHAPRASVSLETCGPDATALRRAAEAGITAVTIRIASARADTYARIHGPLAHRWSDVRASIEVAVERGLDLTIALLVLPGLTDRTVELDAIVALLGGLPGGRLELRDLGADPLRVCAALPDTPRLGMREALQRIGEADHFHVDARTALPV